jgi:hypothetical protein
LGAVEVVGVDWRCHVACTVEGELSLFGNAAVAAIESNPSVRPRVTFALEQLWSQHEGYQRDEDVVVAVVEDIWRIVEDEGDVVRMVGVHCYEKVGEEDQLACHLSQLQPELADLMGQRVR